MLRINHQQIDQFQINYQFRSRLRLHSSSSRSTLNDILHSTFMNLLFMAWFFYSAISNFVLCVILTQFKYNTHTDMVEMSIQWFIFCAFFNLLCVIFISMSSSRRATIHFMCYLSIRMQMNVYVESFKTFWRCESTEHQIWTGISRKTQIEFVKWSQNMAQIGTVSNVHVHIQMKLITRLRLWLNRHSHTC